MQIKSLFAAALAGILCLSACVKNVESPEVTALRNARADEIRANAELLRANAELVKAQTAVENAQVAYTNAQTAAENARAAYIQAQTAYQNAETALAEAQKALLEAQTETEKANAAAALANAAAAQAQAEMAKTQAEQAKAQAELALQQAAYQKELAALQHELAMLQQQQQLADAIANDKLTANDNLLTLVNQYSSASNTLFNMKNDVRNYENNIANYEKQIADLEAGIIDPQEANAEDIASWKAEIARLQKQIEAIKAYQTASPDELQDKLNDARIVLMQAQTDFQKKLEAENEANNAYWDQRNRVYNNTVYYKYVYNYWEYIRQYAYNMPCNPFGLAYQYNDKEEIGEYGFWTPDADPKFVVLWKNFVWKYAEGEDYPAAKDGILPSVSEWIQPSVSAKGGVLSEEGFKALYAAGKKPLEEALAAAKALDPADPAAVEAATLNLTQFEEEWAKLNENIKTALDSKAAFDAEVKKAEEAYAAWITARKARIDAEIVRNDAQDEFYAIQTNLTYYDEYGAARDVNAEIEWRENQIEALEDQIEFALANTENDNANIEDNIKFYKQQIARAEERIAELQELIAVQEKVVADLKAQLEEAMNEAAADTEAGE